MQRLAIGLFMLFALAAVTTPATFGQGSIGPVSPPLVAHRQWEFQTVCVTCEIGGAGSMDRPSIVWEMDGRLTPSEPLVTSHSWYLSSEPSGIYCMGCRVTPWESRPLFWADTVDWSHPTIPLVPRAGETNTFDADYSAIPAQPGVVSFSWMLVDSGGNVVRTGSGNPLNLTIDHNGTYQVGIAFLENPKTIHDAVAGDYSVSQTCFDTRSLDSGFGFTSTSSTGECYGTLPYCAPALGDTVTFDWHSNRLNPVKSFVILRESTNGPGAIQPTNTGRTFELADEFSIGPPLNYDPYGGYSHDSFFTGTATWRPAAPFREGLYCVGFRFNDEHVELSNQGFGDAVVVQNVVTDVYTDTPFYPGADTQAATNVHYTLSSPADSCTLWIGDNTTIRNAPGAATDNVYEWNGTTDDGNHCGPGVLPVDVTSDSGRCALPLNLQLGDPLRITPSGSQMTPFFVPDDGDKISIPYTVAECVKRPQATVATIRASVYDRETGQIVKILPEQTGGIDNKVAPPPSAYTPIVWDGTDQSGESTVLPGQYTIAFVAEDNAGVGCESVLRTVDVEVGISTKPDENLNLGQADGDQTHINGWTQLSGNVNWSDSVGGSDVAPVDAAGDFGFTISDDPGKHTITASITKPDTTTHTETLEVFITGLTSTSPPSDLLPEQEDDAGATSMQSQSASASEQQVFSPDSGGTASVTFTAQVADQDNYDVAVLDVFDAPECINIVDSPAPAYTLLNGSLSLPKTVRTIWQNREVTGSPVTVTWDGNDDFGGTLPAGPYVIQIKRSNGDGLKYLSFCTDVTIDSTGSAPVISDIQEQIRGTTVIISWKTDVPTDGAVLYANADGPVGRVTAKAGTFHLAYLTVQPDTAYSYWIVAKDAAGGSAASGKRSLISGAGEAFDDAKVTVNTTTTATVTWTTLAAAYGRVEYAAAEYSMTDLTWHTATESFATSQHSINLQGLIPNAEYVYRLSSSTDPAFVAVSTSSYGGFVTKLSKPYVEITTPQEGEVVSGTTSVAVHAGDPLRRFTPNGIQSVELSIDGTPVGPPSHMSETDEYDFQIDASLLGPGFHELRATATDDFWRSAQYVRTVLAGVDSAGQSTLSSSVMSVEGLLNTDKLKLTKKAVVAANQPAVPKGKKLTMILVGNNQKMLDPKITANALSLEQRNYGRVKYSCLTYDAGAFAVNGDFEQLFLRLFECGRLKGFTYFGHGDWGSLSVGDDPSQNMWEIAADDLYNAHCAYHQQHPNGQSRRLSNLRLFACHSRRPAQFTDPNTRQKTDAYLDRYCSGCGHSDSTAHVDALAVGRCCIASHSVTYKFYLWPIHMYYKVVGSPPR